MNNLDRHDQMLLEILQEKKSVNNFLDAIFGFLARRTDFYTEMKNPTDNMGFPPGYTEKLVFSTLKKYDPKFQNKGPKTATMTCPPVVNEIEVETSQQDKIIESSEKITNTAKETKDVEMKTVGPFFQPNEYYNGSKFDIYCWSQTITDLEIHVRLPEHIKTAKNLNVQISLDSLRIQEKSTNNVILEGRMIHKCKNNEAVWNILNGKLQITLDKIKELWWNRLFDNEPEIDLSKMDCSRTIDELPEDQKAIFERLEWDQQQELMGLPTSEEIKNAEILRKAWNVEGSPFKGQPFDPSIVKFN